MKKNLLIKRNRLQEMNNEKRGFSVKVNCSASRLSQDIPRYIVLASARIYSIFGQCWRTADEIARLIKLYLFIYFGNISNLIKFYEHIFPTSKMTFAGD